MLWHGTRRVLRGVWWVGPSRVVRASPSWRGPLLPCCVRVKVMGFRGAGRLSAVRVCYWLRVPLVIVVPRVVPREGPEGV